MSPPLLRFAKGAVAFAVSSAALLAADPGWRSLWNGSNFDGWTTWLGTPQPTSEVPGLAKGPNGKYTQAIGADRDPLNVFTVTAVEGRPAIRISGEIFGEMTTLQSLHDYRLRLQFKWGKLKWPPRNAPGRQRDSGLLYHVHSEPGAVGRVWPRCFEFQIQERDVGDLYAVGSLMAVRSTLRANSRPPIYDYDPAGTWHDFSQVPGSDGRCVKQPDNEKPSGEWNNLELVCFGEDSLHIVNGKVVMRLHDPRRIDRTPPQSVTSGPILLQSEGAEVFYRDIAWRPITALPSE